MQSWQDKKYSSRTPNQDLEKTVPPGSAPTRLPAWANALGNRPPASFFGQIGDLQAEGVVSQPGDPYEKEAGQIADQVMHIAAPRSGGNTIPPALPGTSSQRVSSISHAPSMIQRAEAEEGATSAETTAGNASVPAESTPASDMSTAEATSENTPSDETSTMTLIVDDSAEQLGPGQMKKSDFLAQLKAAVCTTTEEALKGTIWSAAGCPWVEHWFGYYSNRNSQQIERALRRYAPETASATSASDYIPILCMRVRRAITAWSTTGEITGVPQGVELPAAGLMGTIGSIASGGVSTGTSIVSSVESAASRVASAGANLVSNAGSALSTVGSMFFKGREGGAREASNPQAIQGQLGVGRSLESGVRSQMESAFGVDFSHVRVHTDTRAEGLSTNLNARAFTVGKHVAFGSGEYQPGSLIGDALIAHELAHVVQQQGVNQAQPVQQASVSYNSLEEDADMSAVGAITSLWSGAKGMLADVAQHALPNLRSGLRLQRCSQNLLEELQKMQNARAVHNRLDSLKDEDLDKLQKDAPAGSLLGQGILWEKAFRKHDWTSIAKYSRTDKEGFYEAYNDPVIEQIMAGKTNIKVENSLADWVKGQFTELSSQPIGFRLIIDLLATGQPINITQTTGEQETKPIVSEQDSKAGRFISTDAEGKPLPLEQQKKGSSTGSNIAINPGLFEKQVTLGKTGGNLSIVKTESAVTFGHELIHALHNARGENIAPLVNPALLQIAGGVNLVREAATDKGVSAEELRTITGQTSFQAPSSVKGPVTWPLAYNLPSEDNITENMLRSERNLPERVSHVGATRAHIVKASTSETIDQLLSRYYMKDGKAVPDQIKIVLKEVFREFNPMFQGRDSLSPESQNQVKEWAYNFPHEQYLAIYLAYIKKQKDLADIAADIRLRGSS